ncbi:hypothetical protein OEZ85_008046 [Tetradesmus obliquus]|uniref:Uncharacterized protein n=1 Tax=Tetradesmus obliquus TaxID=3088 RepID=A0ABY8THR3_TETOB|nr:hypothetical protein OEZ85_008046 [Tetradesmus obliquus]
MQHDALVSFVDLLGWLRDQHTKAKASDEQQQEQQQQQQKQQPSLASLLGNTSELLLLDQLRYLPYSGADSHATGSGSAAAAAAKPKGRGLQDDEDEEAASNLERRITPPGDLMYWLRWLLAQPLHPEAHTITAEQLTQRYAKSLRELSMLLHQVDNGSSGHSPAPRSNGTNAPAEQEADSADAVADPYERMGRILLQHNHMMVSVVLAGRNHVLSAFCLANPETGKSRTEHDMERYNWALQQIKLSPEQVADTVGVTKVFQRIYAPVAAQLRELQIELSLQPAGTTADAGAGASSNAFGIYGDRSMVDTSSSSSSGSGGSGGSSRVTEAEVQPPSSMLKHLTESDAKAQKLARLSVLLQKDAMIKMGVGQLLGGVLEVTQLARLMVLLAYPVNWTTYGLTISEMHKQQMLELDHPQQQQQHGLRYVKRHQPTVFSKKRVSLVRKKLEVCNISEL